MNMKIIVTNYTNKLDFCDNLIEKLWKDCDCLRLAISTIFIIRAVNVYPFTRLTDRYGS